MSKRSIPTPGPVYGAKIVATILDFTYMEEELIAFGSPPEPLPGFLTFFDPGFSILRMRVRYSAKAQGRLFHPQDWYMYEGFAHEEQPPSYRQLRMEAVKESFFKTYADQQTLLPSDEEVPLARVVVTGMIVDFLAFNERLFHNVLVRCRDVDSDGNRMYVGNFGRDGLRVDSRWDDVCGSALGLASSRKV